MLVLNHWDQPEREIETYRKSVSPRFQLALTQLASFVKPLLLFFANELKTTSLTADVFLRFKKLHNILKLNLKPK